MTAGIAAERAGELCAAAVSAVSMAPTTRERQSVIAASGRVVGAPLLLWHVVPRVAAAPPAEFPAIVAERFDRMIETFIAHWHRALAR